MKNSWETAAIYDGVNLGNGTWMYHVDVSDHNNEGGKYITHIYIFDNLGNAVIYVASQIIETANYIGSLYFSDTDAIFNGDRQYCIGDKILSNNFTFEFDAKPTKETPIYPLRTYADTKIDTHNFILMDIYGSGDTAGIGLALGTNGVVAIAHKAGYYYVLLTYTGDLSSQHRYKFTVRNNIPYLYIDGNLVSTGISPLAPASILVTNGCVTGGNYGNYTGYANNFILYNDAR